MEGRPSWAHPGSVKRSLLRVMVTYQLTITQHLKNDFQAFFFPLLLCWFTMNATDHSGSREKKEWITSDR